MHTFAEVFTALQSAPPRTLAIAGAEDSDVTEAFALAVQSGWAKGILLGNKAEIEALLAARPLPQESYTIEECAPAELAARSVAAVAEGRAHILMKGKIKTGELMKAVLHKTKGLNTGRMLSHVCIVQKPGGGFLLVSDGGMIPAPALEEKTHIIANAVEIAQGLGIKRPRVGVVSSQWGAPGSSRASGEAADLAVMGRRGQIAGAEIEGPVPLDSVTLQSYEDNWMTAAPADIVVLPDLESGNIMGKALIYLAGLETALIVAGAKVPIVLTSRSNAPSIRLNSIALALWVQSSQANRLKR